MDRSRGGVPYRFIVDHVSDAIVVWRPGGEIVYFSPSAERLFGLSDAEASGQPLSILLAPKLHGRFEAEVRRWRETGRTRPTGRPVIVACRRADGAVFPAELVTGSDPDAVSDTGRATRIVGVFRDVSDRLEVAAVRRRSESLRQMIDGLPDAVFVHRDGRLVYANRTFLSLLGHADAGDLLERPIRSLLHPEDVETLRQRLRRIEQTGKPDPPHEERFRAVDGRWVTLEVAKVPLEFDGEPAVVAIGRDVAERRRSDAVLAAADRMAAVGTLAAGVAHGINNPLTFVKGNVAFVREELARLAEAGADRQVLEEAQHALVQAEEGANRIRDVVSDLLTFCRDDADDRASADVHAVVESVLSMARDALRGRARLVTRLGPVSRPVAGEPSKLAHALINLVLNAAEAMPDGDPREQEIRLATRETGGDEIEIEVEDTGPGVPDALRERIFEPFYTTRPAESGTAGLGLSVSLGIVRGLGGRIEVGEGPEGGARFRLVLPLARNGSGDGPLGVREGAVSSARP